MPSVAVGTSTVQLGSSTLGFQNGCQLVADPSNSGVVYVGYSSGVTAGTTAATDGLPLEAGAGYFIGPDRQKSLSQIYVIASAVSQKIFYDAA